MGNGYTRQSIAEITTGNTIEAAPLNAEFNQIQAAFNSTSGHSHDGTVGEGPKISLVNSVDGILQVVNGGTGGINKLDATTAPTVNDDILDGYAIGSVWIDTTNKLIYTCVNNTIGSAEWKIFQPLDSTLTGLAAVVVNAADRLIYSTGTDLFATTALTSYGRSLIDDADASTARTTLGLGNVDNTSDLNKPISTATQTALDLKQNIADRNILVGFRNKLINSDCMIWQRGLGPLSNNGYQMDRCQINSNDGTTFSTRFNTLVPGQVSVPGNAKACQRIDVTAGGGYCFWQQRVEDVRTLSGGKATFTDYIRSPGAGYKLTLVVTQAFGTGGSPSATVVYPVGKYTFLTGSDFEKVQFVFDVPSVYGKTIGTNEDSYLAVELWLCASSASDSYLGGSANNPGQQSGTWYHSRFSLVFGDASSEADPGGSRDPQQEEALCMRYYEAISTIVRASVSDPVYYKVRKRATPSVGGGGAGFSSGGVLTKDVTFAQQNTLAFQTLTIDAEL